MAKISYRRRGVLENPEEVLTLAQQLLEQAKRQWKWIAGVLIVVAVALSAWSITAAMRASKEAGADQALFQVRAQLDKKEASAEGIKALDQFIQQHGGTAAAWHAQLLRANFLYEMKRFADAAKAYEALEGRDPGMDLLLKSSISYCYEGLGEYQKAAAVLKPLADQGPELFKGDFLRRMAMLYEQAKDPKEAAVYWRKLAENPPDPSVKPYAEEKLAAIEALEKKQPGK